MATPARKPQRNRTQWLLSLLLFSALVLLSLRSITGVDQVKEYDDAKEVPLSQITSGYTQEKYEKIEIRDNSVYATLKGSGVLTAYKGYESIADLGWNDPENPTPVEIKNRESLQNLKRMIPDILFFLLVIVGIIWLFRSIARSQSSAMSFGKSRARITDAKQVKTRFKDVAGMEESKEELVEVVDFLKHPKKYINMGAKIPKGLLLVGAPGTGKTLLARAVAGEAGVPFFSIAGSEFVEMFVGVGASRVRDLFARAKRNAPCIIFIDEIDAVGRQRGGAGFGGGHDEREQTLNQILTEMDGFDQGTNVIVMAATNRPDVLDKALLRPGRFDRRVFVDRPDLNAREKILEVHSKNKKMGRSVNLHEVAKQTVGLTGADLENIMNEAAIIAAKGKHKTISHQDCIDAVEKVTMGREKKSRQLTQKEKDITAYHELGHAIVGYLCPDSDPLHKISIVSRGSALGVTWFLPQEDQFTTSKSKFYDEICGLLGGRAAEKLIFDEITTGASNDIERASQIARDMAMRYGMGTEDLGPVAYGEKQGSMFLGVDPSMSRNYSEQKAQAIDEFVRVTIQEQYERALDMLTKHRTLLDKLAKILLEKETMSLMEFLEIFDSKEAEKRKKSESKKKSQKVRKSESQKDSNSVQE